MSSVLNAVMAESSATTNLLPTSMLSVPVPVPAVAAPAAAAPAARQRPANRRRSRLASSNNLNDSELDLQPATPRRSPEQQIWIQVLLSIAIDIERGGAGCSAWIEAESNMHMLEFVAASLGYPTGAIRSLIDRAAARFEVKQVVAGSTAGSTTGSTARRPTYANS